MASTLISGLAVAAPAMAQDDVVTVTGSRIQRTDTIAPSPVTNVSAEQLAVVNTINTEDFINTLPQVVPSFDATSNNPGDGTARVSLRGLGSTRTLVLVDGQRFVGSGVTQIVDLNNIPAAMVQSVDIVTGGASAVYGSDAVAGVVNFLLKDDFEGVEVNASHELSLGDLDGEITTLSITMGGNFDNGRGNAVLSMGYTNRVAVFQGDRPNSSETLWDPGAGNAADGFILGGSSNIPGTRFRGGSSTNFGAFGAALIAGDTRCDAPNFCSGFFNNGDRFWVCASATRTTCTTTRRPTICSCHRNATIFRRSQPMKSMSTSSSTAVASMPITSSTRSWPHRLLASPST